MVTIVGSGLAGIWYLVVIALYVLNGLAFMNLGRLAGRPDTVWMPWIPICNIIQQLILIRKSGWWVLMLLVPIANFIFFIIWQVQLLRAFDKSGAFVLLWIFLNPVYTILWIVWGMSKNTRYVGVRR